jgi:ParB family chromosome partitioning protein
MKVKVSSLKHHPKNKEIYDLSSIDELMESISEIGLLQPLTIDTRNQVISGNRRFESIKRLGWNQVEVIVREVQEEDEELLLIHFNKQRIKSFKELINEYLTLIGFTEKDKGEERI